MHLSILQDLILSLFNKAFCVFSQSGVDYLSSIAIFISNKNFSYWNYHAIFCISVHGLFSLLDLKLIRLHNFI